MLLIIRSRVTPGKLMMAVDWDKLKTRYLKDDVATQLRSIASNLARIKSIARSGADEQVAQYLIRESQFFIAMLGLIPRPLWAAFPDLRMLLLYMKLVFALGCNALSAFNYS